MRPYFLAKIHPTEVKINKLVLPSFAIADFQSNLFSIIERHTLSGRRRAKKCREAFVLAKGSFTPLVSSNPRSRTRLLGFHSPLYFPFIAPRNSAVVFAISLGHFKGYLSQYQNGAAGWGWKRLHEERVLSLFIGSVSLAAAMSPTSSYRGYPPREESSRVVWKETTRTRTPWRHLTYVCLIKPPISLSSHSIILSHFIPLCST